MAYLTKDEYERRERYAEHRMRENAEADTLTEDQHDALAMICRVRHTVHSCDRMVLLNDETPENDYWDYIDTENSDNPIKAEIEEAGLPEWQWKFDCVTELTYLSLREISDELGDDWDDEREKHEDELICQALEEIGDAVEKWNDSIEAYLAMIDKEHGTNYCPSGKYRI